jgi:hypothetical protein
MKPFFSFLFFSCQYQIFYFFSMKIFLNGYIFSPIKLFYPMKIINERNPTIFCHWYKSSIFWHGWHRITTERWICFYNGYIRYLFLIRRKINTGKWKLMRNISIKREKIISVKIDIITNDWKIIFCFSHFFVEISAYHIHLLF